MLWVPGGRWEVRSGSVGVRVRVEMKGLGTGLFDVAVCKQKAAAAGQLGVAGQLQVLYIALTDPFIVRLSGCWGLVLRFWGPLRLNGACYAMIKRLGQTHTHLEC